MFCEGLVSLLICLCVGCRISLSGTCVHTWPPKRTPQYPYGRREANETAQGVDDATIEVKIPGNGFRFYESNFRSVFVHLDGVITLGTKAAPVMAMGFPFPDIPAIAPLWLDVDTRRSGRLYVQSGTVPALLERANKDIRRALSDIAKTFTATWALVATWDKVGLFDKQRDKTNSFQCVLVTNSSMSVALFIYYRKGLRWSSGDADPENAYNIGVNAGDGVRYLSLPEEESVITSISSLSEQSNIDIAGMWILRLDGTLARVPTWKVFDGCATDPCHKHGLCNRERKEGKSVFTCRCSNGFSGPCCETDDNECSSTPCLYGGVCIDLPGSFKCNCSLGYSGVFCEKMACGNGVLEQGEECDDGNKNLWDGCSDTCRVDRLWNCSGKLAEHSSCHVIPIDLDVLNPETTSRRTVYTSPMQQVFLADPDLLDCGEIRSKDWELVEVVLTNLIMQAEHIAFSPELSRDSSQINISIQQASKVRESVMLRETSDVEKGWLKLEVVRKTGRSVDLTIVLLSIFYEVVVDHNDYRPRTVTVAVKLNSGAISPPSEVNLQYVGQNANAPQIQLGVTNVSFTERSSPVSVTQMTLSLDDGDSSYYNIKWATVSLTQKKERYLHEELALNLSSAEVNVTFDPNVLVLSLNGSASRSVYSKLLNSVTYMNWATKLSGFSSRPVLFRVSDGDHVSKALIYIDLQTVNEPPVISIQGSAFMSYSEGEGPAELGGRVVVTDPDGDNIHSANLHLQDSEHKDTISVDYSISSSVTVTLMSPSHLTLQGEASVSTYGEIMSSVSFHNPTSNLTRKSRMLVMAVSDGELVSEAVIVTVNVEIVNSRPMVTFARKRRFDAVYETHGESLNLFPATTEFTDGDSRTASGMRILMSGAIDGLAEELSVDKDLASNYGLEWTSSWPNETTYDLEVSGYSYFEAYLELLLSVYYVHNGAQPKSGERVLTVVGSDGQGASSLPATVHVMVRSVNQPPQLDMGRGFGVDGSTDFSLAGDTAVSISSRPERIDIIDQDSSHTANVSVHLKSGNDQAMDSDEFVFLAYSISDRLNVCLSSDGKAMNITGPADKAVFVEALQAIRYAHTSKEPTTLTLDGSARLERWVVIVVCDTGTASGSDDACSVAKIAIRIATTLSDSHCPAPQVSFSFLVSRSLPQCHKDDFEQPIRNRRIQLRSPMVDSIEAFGNSKTFGAGAVITVKFSHNVNKPPVMARQDLQRVLSLSPKEIAMSGYIGQWKDNRTLVIYFPRVKTRDGPPIHADELLITFKVPEGRCGTIGGCKHAICHADGRSCSVTGIYDVGVYKGEVPDVSPTGDMHWFALFIAGICGCLCIMTIYAVIMMARIRCRNTSCLYWFSILVAGCLCITTISAMVALAWF